MFILSLLNYPNSFSPLTKAGLVVITIFLLLLAAFCYRVFLKPRLIIKHYTSQGIKTCLFSMTNPIKTWDKLALQTGDCFSPWTDFVNKNPDAPAFISNLGPFIHLQLVDSALVKEFYQKEFEYYKKAESLELLAILFENTLGIISYGPWKARRRLYSQAFHYEFLKDNLHVIENQAVNFCNHVHPSKLRTFSALKETKNYTGLVSGQLFFGEDLSNVLVEGAPIIQYLSDICDDMLSYFSSFLVFLFGRQIIARKILPAHRELLRQKAVFREACRQFVIKKEQELQNTDYQKAANAQKDNLLQIFIKSKSDPETQLDDNTIISEFMGFFFAGVDTTSTLLTNAYYYLAAYPEVANRIREEISANWQTGQPLTMDIINKLDYLYAFLKEVLRVSSITFTVAQREATKDHKLGNLEIKKGTTVMVGGRAMSFHPKYYKDAFVFDPTRFMRKDPEEMFNSDPFIFLPFSSGRRNCLGQHLAFLEARVLLIHLLTRYDLAFPPKFKKCWHIEHGFYTPIEPLKPILTPRDKE